MCPATAQEDLINVFTPSRYGIGYPACTEFGERGLNVLAGTSVG
jgi:hypothetical protein